MGISLLEFLMLIGVPSIITLLAGAAFNKLAAKRQSHADGDELTKKALQALLRNELRNQYVEFINQGWVDMDDKSNFSNMYDIYHALGKNGVMDQMSEQVISLPTQPLNPSLYKRRKEDKTE